MANSTSSPLLALHSCRLAALASLWLALAAYLTLPQTRAMGWDESMHAALPAARMAVAAQQLEWMAASDALLDCAQYPPVWPIALALWQTLSGISDSSARAASALSLGALAFAVFLLARRASLPGRGAWWAFALVALSPLCWAYGSTLFLEVPFAAAAAWTVHAWLRRSESRQGPLLAGAAFSAAFFLKFNYGLLLLAGLGAAWCVELFDAWRKGTAREHWRELPQLLCVPSLCALLWFVLLRGAEHREAFLGFLQGNREFAFRPYAERCLHVALSLHQSPRTVLLVGALVLWALTQWKSSATRTLLCIALAMSVPAWLHPFHLDRFLIPQAWPWWCLSAIAVASLGRMQVCAWFALALSIPGAYDRTALADRLGYLSADAQVRSYQLQIYERWGRLGAGRELPTNGLTSAEHQALVAAIVREAPSAERVGWIGVSSQFSPAVLHLARLEHGLAPERFLAEAERPIDVDYFGGGPEWGAAELARFAAGFDVIFFTDPTAMRKDAARESLLRFPKMLETELGWNKRELLALEIQRPLPPHLPLKLYALRPPR